MNFTEPFPSGRRGWYIHSHVDGHLRVYVRTDDDDLSLRLDWEDAELLRDILILACADNEETEVVRHNYRTALTGLQEHRKKIYTPAHRAEKQAAWEKLRQKLVGVLA
jgi:hypothetical protein